MSPDPYGFDGKLDTYLQPDDREETEEEFDWYDVVGQYEGDE